MNPADKIVSEAFDNLPRIAQSVASHTSLYGRDTGFMTVGLTALMAKAVPMRRSRYAECRAQAIEFAFDQLLTAGTDCWKREGEVRLDRENGEAVAFCIRINEDREEES